MAEMEDYFAKRRQELGFERLEILNRIQSLLDQWYPHQTRAKRLDKDILTIVVTSSVIASELRLHQTELLSKLELGDTRMVIRQGNLSD